MRSAAKKAQELLNEASDGKVEFEYPIFGEFVLNETEKPKVVIYLKSIENSKGYYESRESVMAAVFVHEMFMLGIISMQSKIQGQFWPLTNRWLSLRPFTS